MFCRIASYCGLVAFALLCCQRPAQAQLRPLIFEKFSDEQGLPNNLFKQTIEDRDGILWMYGQDGLVRYDGYSITPFRHSNADTTSISGNSIFALFEDSWGRLWVSSFGGGLDISNTSKTAFHHVNLLRPDGTRLSANIIDQINEDPLGNLWIFSDTAIYIVKEEAHEFTAYHFREFFSDIPTCQELQRPTVMMMGRDSTVWLGTGTGLCIYDLAENRLLCPEDIDGLPVKSIQEIEYDREGRIWIACSNSTPRLYYANRGTRKFLPFNNIEFQFRTQPIQFTFDLDNRIWIGAFQDQVYGYDFRDSAYFLKSSVNSNVTHERFLRNPFLDHSGNIWLHGDGYLIYPYPKGFFNYLHPFTYHQSGCSVFGTEDAMWYGYRQFGMLRVDKKTGDITQYATDAPAHLRLSDNQVTEVVPLRSGNRLLVEFGNVDLMDRDGNIIKRFAVGGSNRTGMQDSQGRIWIGGFAGLLRLSEQHGVEDTFSLPPRLGEARNFIQGIAEDRSGRIWFGSGLHGLAVLNTDNSVTQFVPVPGDLNSLPSGIISDMTIDGDILWIATDVALVRFDTKTFAIKSYDRSYGFESDYISSVELGPHGKIWAGTNAGITAFDPVTETCRNFGRGDGLLNKSYYTSCRFKDKNGTLYFGGENGFDYFIPEELRQNPAAPKMVLNSITINNDTTLFAADIALTEGLNLSYRDEQIEIAFTGLYYGSQNKVAHAYRVDGIHDHWLEIGNQRKVVFSSFEPGDYVFRAKALSPDGVLSEGELQIPIHVEPPFYETLWFRIFGSIALIALLIAYIKFREHRIQTKERKDAEVSRQINELERRALQAQMNPHFIYNCMNSIQQFMILHDYEGAMRYLTRFSRILRTVLNVSALPRITLSDEIKLIEDYIELENMRFPNKFEYEIDVSPEINIHTIEIPPFFVQPQVENAIRHGLLAKGHDGNLLVKIDKEGQYLHIIVEDNGIGREAARNARQNDRVIHESKGLTIVKERLAHMHSGNGANSFNVVDLKDSDGNATGTRVEITLPIE